MMHRGAAGDDTGAETTILFVEDETLIRIAAVDDLMGAGYNVIDACNADEAMRILIGSPFIELLITDVQMPGTMDGLDLAIAARRHLPDLKIIIISGHLQAPAAAPVADAFLAKPYSPDALIQTVSTVFN